ncbi:hypothetical protein OH77DRAFT_1419927 [Trametes cingulata]|nr:hypothetical protein OH77DRAFT_1419927 [Trametes cingulata]
MDTLPLSLHAQILEFACTHDGSTARSLTRRCPGSIPRTQGPLVTHPHTRCADPRDAPDIWRP